MTNYGFTKYRMIKKGIQDTMVPNGDTNGVLKTAKRTHDTYKDTKGEYNGFEKI